MPSGDIDMPTLLELATATRALVALSVEMAGQGIIIEVLPGNRNLLTERTSAYALVTSRAAPGWSGRRACRPAGQRCS
jgi:hypothetical protein